MKTLLSIVLAAQSFLPGPVVNLSAMLNGWPVQVFVRDADPVRPGPELIVFAYPSFVTVVVPNHPTKSGYLGIFQTPGPCMEPWANVPLIAPPGYFQYADMFDVVNATGALAPDGKVDWIINSSNGVVQALAGQGLVYCR